MRRALRRGELVHLELHTSNLACACSFHPQLLDWRPEPITACGRSYMSINVGFSAGIVECHPQQPGWIPYIQVDDIDVATARAVASGAAMRLAPRDGPQGQRSDIRSVHPDRALWQSS